MTQKQLSYYFLLLLALLLGSGQTAYAQMDKLTQADWTEIKGQAFSLVDYYAQLLNNISIEEIPETQQNKLIANAYDPDFPRAGFADGKVQIEYDLTPSGFQRGSGSYQEVSDYLRAFTLLYLPQGKINSVETKFLGCRTFEESYPGVQVIFELKFAGVNKRGESFGSTQKTMETIAKRENGQWRVYINGITHFSGALDEYACKDAFELDSDTDGVPDAIDECPYEFGFRTISGCPDDDLDGVPNKYDPCPKLAGPKDSEGCPDSDNDGLPDHQDDCPYDAGLVKYKGCPDSDGDGVLDKVDRCRFTPGLVELDGCPDKDGDGIPDIDDKCPDKPGVLEYRGCPEPDLDADGVPDSLDECVDVPGPVRLKGCPDGDGDGVLDKNDDCPTVFGSIKANGCPDKDGDGIPNISDACPKRKGLPENQGCPGRQTQKGDFLGNTYVAVNYELFNRTGFQLRPISMEHSGVALYAPIGGYFFGYTKNDTPRPAPAYSLYQLNQMCQELEGKGFTVEKPTLQGFKFSGSFYHAGACVGPFYKIKYLRHLFFTAGLTFMNGAAWEEYTGDFKGALTPSYGENNYAVNLHEFDQETRLETGIALVFPFVHTELTYYSYLKTWSWKAGVNIPLGLIFK
ncbi:MAG: thrombospondin type 3 repeat-containing protein [Saprospirales bacterium]|nr:thrombospondin type 3 repeat-containing protein [Saprospirales bacterium]